MNKNVLITGSSRGLGASLKNLFNRDHWKVYEINSSNSDLSDNLCNNDYLHKLLDKKFHTVIINAATAGIDFDFNNPLSDFANKVFNINCVNQLKIVEALNGNITNRLIFISSHSASFKNTSNLSNGPLPFRKLIYRCSKISLNLAATYYSTVLPNLNVYLINPGSMETGFEGVFEKPKTRNCPMFVAQNIYSLIDDSKYTGRFINWDGTDCEL